MNRTSRSVAVTFAVALLILLGSRPARAATPIVSCGTVLTEPGEYYVANDLVAFAGDCIDIVSDRVTVRLDGHTITGSGPGPTINGIAANGVEKVRIQGPGVIQRFRFDVHLRQVDRSEVLKVTCGGPAFDGILLESSSENKLLNNTIDGPSTGIRVFGSSTLGNANDNQIVGNTVTTTRTGTGISVSGDRNSVVNNTVSALDAIIIRGDSNDVIQSEIMCISPLGHSGIGIDVGATNSDFESNLITNCGNGILVRSSDNQFNGNTSTNNGRGLFVFAGAADNRFTGNDFTGNLAQDVDDLNIPACVNVYQGDRCEQLKTNDPTGACIQCVPPQP